VITFDRIVGVLPCHVCGGGDQLAEDPQVRVGLRRWHVDLRRAVPQGAGEESAGGGVPLLGEIVTSMTWPY
jgi:hypothetical protein